MPQIRWNPRDLLVGYVAPSGQRATFTHRWDDLRASIDPGDGGDATKLIWDPLGTSGYTDILVEVTAAGSLARQYWRGARLVSYKEPGQKGIYGFDHLGNTERLTDAAQAVLAAYRASAWGEALVTTGSLAGQRFQFGGDWGAYRDALSSDLWMRARVMVPDLGRFLSKDAMLGYREHPNSYWYVRNLPALLIDPTGLKVCICKNSWHGQSIIPSHQFISTSSGAWGLYGDASDPLFLLTGRAQVRDDSQYLKAPCVPADPKLTQCLEIYVTPQFEEGIVSCVDDFIRNPPPYWVGFHDCRQFSTWRIMNCACNRAFDWGVCLSWLLFGAIRSVPGK